VWKNTPFLCLILLLIVGGFVFWTLLGLCTMRIYVEDMEGELKYIGRRWVRYEKEHFVVRIPMEIIEKCTTTHFLLCSSVLFTSLFKEKDIAFLFPEEICIIRKVKRNIEISLL
ncbi:MAG: hypothetical protein IJ274_05835, partial [Lachnospiraceae bacterium]|nr:hypothetical protein [Lachnospiraceae bacterium]